jgi:sulfatase modifying factor 1
MRGYDPYLKLLGIPPDRRPPSHRDLLGVGPDEIDIAKLEQAAQERREHLKKYDISPQEEVADAARRLLHEISDALVALRNVVKSAPPPGAAQPQPAVGTPPPLPVPAQDVGAAKPSNEASLGDGPGSAVIFVPVQDAEPLVGERQGEAMPPLAREELAAEEGARLGQVPEPISSGAGAIGAGEWAQAGPASQPSGFRPVELLRRMGVGLRSIPGRLFGIVRWADGLLRTIAGKDNTILHGFFRLGAIAIVVPAVVYVGWLLCGGVEGGPGVEVVSSPGIGSVTSKANEPSEDERDGNAMDDLDDMLGMLAPDDSAIEAGPKPEPASTPDTPTTASSPLTPKPETAPAPLDAKLAGLPPGPGSTRAPSGTEPFRDFPGAVDLPPLSSAGATGGELPLALIRAPAEVRWELNLVGGDRAVRNGVFTLQEQEPPGVESSWTVRIGRAGAANQPAAAVARFRRNGEALMFRWIEGASGTAEYLRNCALEVRVDASMRRVALRKPKKVDPVLFDLTKPRVSSKVSLPWPPDLSHVRLEVTRVEGRKEFTLTPNQPLPPNEQATLVFVKTSDTGNLLRRLDFNPQFDVKGQSFTVSLAQSKGQAAMALNSGRLPPQVRALYEQIVQTSRGLQLNGVPVGPGIGQRGRTLVPAMTPRDAEVLLWYDGLLQELHHKSLLHFRIFVETREGCRVDLASTDGNETAVGKASPDGARPALATAPFMAAEGQRHQDEWSNYLGVPDKISNSVGMTFVLIPPGEFQMGSSDSHAAPDERPQHRVRINGPFYLSVHRVTQVQYAKLTGSRPRPVRPSMPRGSPDTRTRGRAGIEPGLGGSADAGSDASVDWISWKDAQDFCRMLSESPEERQAGRTYRLPTEAQWEYACRAGIAGPALPGGEMPNLGPRSPASRAPFSMPRPIGPRDPNAWGLQDMPGALGEWCADQYGFSYYAQSPPDDPAGPASGTTRVWRGGARGFTARNSSPEDSPTRVGFRVAAAVEAQP